MESKDFNDINTFCFKANKLFRDLYLDLIDFFGLEKTWDFIIFKMKRMNIKEFSSHFLSFDEIGYFYELGLARVNKVSKKEMGKYFTPQDVADLMSDFFLDFDDIKNIADVGCGCGNLIFSLAGKLKSKKRIDEIEQIFLYDIDSLALKIAKERLIHFFKLPEEKIVSIEGDFLKNNIIIKKNTYVITNPPYSVIKKFNKERELKDGFKIAKDLYIGFLEKIGEQSEGFVSVNPQSFLCGRKFLNFRKKLGNLCEGKIFAFDNVPGTLFNGKKLGIFNTNTSNGVRASIVFAKKSKTPGFNLSHLIRFKTEERLRVINKKYLNSILGSQKQDLIQPLKCYKSLEKFVYKIKKIHKNTFNDLVANMDTNFKIYVSSSARYFISASIYRQKRNGIFEINFKDYDSFIFGYALLNSSYCYLWWRMMDGGILLPKSLLLRIPLFKIDKVNFNKLKEVVVGQMEKEKSFLSYKKNAGVFQETVKIPASYRNELNHLLFSNVNFDIIHKNSEF